MNENQDILLVMYKRDPSRRCTNKKVERKYAQELISRKANLYAKRIAAFDNEVENNVVDGKVNRKHEFKKKFSCCNPSYIYRE